MCLKSWLFVVLYSVDFKKDSSICNKYMNSQIALRVSKYHGVMALLKWEPRLQAPLATGRPGVSSAGTGRPHQIWSFSYGPGGWACCLDTRPMGGWASISFFCSGRAGGRQDFVVENRVGVGGRPGTPGPVGGPGEDTRDIHTIPTIKHSASRPLSMAV